jgi:chromosome segregation ATPase
MSIRRLIKLTLLRVPAVRRYAEAKWQLAEALQEARTETNRAEAELSILRQTIESISAEKNKLEKLRAVAERDRQAALEQIQQNEAELKAISGKRDDVMQQLKSARARAEQEEAAFRAQLESARAHAKNEEAVYRAERERARARAEQQDAEFRADRGSLIEQLSDAEFRLKHASLERDVVLDQLKMLQSVLVKRKTEMQLAQASLTRAVAENDPLRANLSERVTTHPSELKS